MTLLDALRRNASSTTLLFGLAMTVAAGSAQASPIDTLASVADTYNVFLSGDMGSASAPYTSDSQGPMAVAGNAYLQSFSTASSSSNGVAALTVGGNLTYQGGTINGNAWVGGNAIFPTNFGGTTVTGTLNVDGTVQTAPTQVNGGIVNPAGALPINFGTAISDLGNASQFLTSSAATSQGATGTVQVNFGNQLVLTGTSGTLNFFTLTASQLSTLWGGSFTLNAPAGSTAIINVVGTAATVGAPGNFGFFYTGINERDVLFNFADATSLTIGSFDGSILAPLATVDFTNGQFNGSLIAGALDSTVYQDGEFHDALFDGTLPTYSGTTGGVPVPEPGSIALLASALLLLGAHRRLYGRRG